MPNTLQDRVRTVIGQVATSQASFADIIGLTKDKLSKSLAGKRRLTSLELALIAQAGGVTVDWLLTGNAPARPFVAARREGSTTALVASVRDLVNRCAAAYEVLDLLGSEARSSAAPAPLSVPGGADVERAAETIVKALVCRRYASVADLGVAELADAVEDVLGIDVTIASLPRGLDGLAWQTNGRRLCVLGSTRQWTRQRFTLAHEIGHLVLGHAQGVVVDQDLAPGSAADPSEIKANLFAAALLMPAAEVRKRMPGPTNGDSFAGLVVDFKVSPSAMAVRLKRLRLIDAQQYHQLRLFSSVECHVRAGSAAEYVRHVNAATSPRLPSRLVTALFEAYREGRTTLRPLANLLDVDVDELRDALTGEPAPDPGRPGVVNEDLAFAL